MVTRKTMLSASAGILLHLAAHTVHITTERREHEPPRANRCACRIYRWVRTRVSFAATGEGCAAALVGELMDPYEAQQFADAPIDPMAMIFITIFVMIVAALLFGWLTAPREKPAEPEPAPDLPLMVDLSLLQMRMEIATNATEITLRQRNLNHEAEGARQVRETVRGLFELVKSEHLEGNS
jgi:hypothetical protein